MAKITAVQRYTEKANLSYTNGASPIAGPGKKSPMGVIPDQGGTEAIA